MFLGLGSGVEPGEKMQNKERMKRKDGMAGDSFSRRTAGISKGWSAFRSKGWGFLFLTFFSLFASGCGGSGGGGSSATGGSSEILYALSTSGGGGSNGSITEIALNTSSGSLYNGSYALSSQTIAVGSNPLQFEFDPNGQPYLFVLNNGSGNTLSFEGGILTATGSANGSVQVFSVGSQGLSINPVDTQLTGKSPVSMAIDNAGVYLAVADQGNGSNSGDVELFQIGPGGSLGPGSKYSSPCSYPNKVLFAPGSDGLASETLYILCSSPEITPLILPAVYYCFISNLSICGSENTIGSNTALFGMTVDPSGTYMVAPGISGGAGILPEFSINSSNKSLMPYANPGQINSTSFIPAGQPAIIVSGTSEKILVGNYDVSSSSSFASGSSTNYAACPISNTSSLSCSLPHLSVSGPIAMITNSAGTALYIPLTGTPVVAGGNYSTGGVIQACPISGGTVSGSCTGASTGAWPLSVTFDSYSHAFVPNYGSGNVSVYSVGTGGALTPISTLNVGSYPVSVLVR